MFTCCSDWFCFPPLINVQHWHRRLLVLMNKTTDCSQISAGVFFCCRNFIKLQVLRVRGGGLLCFNALFRGTNRNAWALVRFQQFQHLYTWVRNFGMPVSWIFHYFSWSEIIFQWQITDLYIQILLLLCPKSATQWEQVTGKLRSIILHPCFESRRAGMSAASRPVCTL